MQFVQRGWDPVSMQPHCDETCEWHLMMSLPAEAQQLCKFACVYARSACVLLVLGYDRDKVVF